MSQSLSGGFISPALESARLFRAIMTAMSHPGKIVTADGLVPPAPLEAAAAAILLTLCDHDTKVAVTNSYDTDNIKQWLIFHTGCKLTADEEADFVLVDQANIAPLTHYRQGSDEYPDRSATLIVSLPEINNKRGVRLSGPGIKKEQILSLSDVSTYRDNMKTFPLGIDFMFTHQETLACVPRSTTMEAF